jgi:hypothetical protein
MTLCDRCGEGVAEWQMWQCSAAAEWRLVREVLDSVADNCAACWMTQPGSAYMHARRNCSIIPELSEAACDEFRAQIQYEVGSNSCFRCGISETLCAARGVRDGMQCQWANVLVPMVRALTGSHEGMAILRRVGYAGECRDWQSYGRWLGQRHGRQVWGEWMSNAMAALIQTILWARQDR